MKQYFRKGACSGLVGGMDIIHSGEFHHCRLRRAPCHDPAMRRAEIISGTIKHIDGGGAWIADRLQARVGILTTAWNYSPCCDGEDAGIPPQGR